MTLQAAAPSLTTPDRELAEDLPSLAAMYRLAPVRTWTRLPHGMMNPNWRLETDSGPLVLKRVMDVSLDKARRNLGAPILLAEAGIPVCAPKRTSGGDVVADVGDRGYCLFAWVDGEHVTGHSLPLGQVADLGRLIGRLHVALRDVAATAGWQAVPSEFRATVCAPQTALAEAERFLGVVASVSQSGPFDREATRWLVERRVLIDKYARLRPADELARGPLGWTHGDLQHRNLLWNDGRMAAILDWDRIAVRPYAEELVRTLLVQFATEDGLLDLERAARFIAGYREVMAMDGEALRDGLRRMWWRRMTDYWVLQWHYERGDAGCDQLWSPNERLLGWWTDRLDQVESALVSA